VRGVPGERHPPPDLHALAYNLGNFLFRSILDRIARSRPAVVLRY
jgi:hypothetical protein